MDFKDIPQFPQAHYQVDVFWSYLEDWLESLAPYELNPDYQRAHVWTPEQKTAYVEFRLQGGESGEILYWNNSNWMGIKGDLAVTEMVDGKQRLEAVRGFLRDEVPVFGRKFSEFKGKLGLSGPGFKMRVAKLPNRAEVLKWYLAINRGGTPHSPKELDRVQKLLDEELNKSA